MPINSLKNKSTMQTQFIIYRINKIPKGSVMTVTNDGNEIIKRNTCGFFNEEIFSSVVHRGDPIYDFVSKILDYWDVGVQYGNIDKETFSEILEEYENHSFAKIIQEAIQSDPDDTYTYYDFSYYKI